jgi:hypothetical protein
MGLAYLREEIKMKDPIVQYFSGIETEKRKALLALMDEWRESLADKEFADFFLHRRVFPELLQSKT